MKPRFVLPALIIAAAATILLLPENAFAQPLEIGELDTTCIATNLQDCHVLTAGRLNIDWGDDEGEPLFAWQTQSGFTAENGISGGFVLLRYLEGSWTLFDSGFDAARFEAPRLSPEGSMLHIAGYSGGTGAYNADRLYVWEDENTPASANDWTQIDIESWRENIDSLLPEGLEIWKGVDFDFSDFFYGELTARTPLWHADDANCCPSGGWAFITFEIDQHRLVATRLDHLPPTEQ
jgi:hypothetical protein